MKKVFLLLLFLVSAFAGHAQILLNEGFNVTTTTATPPTGWTVTSTGTNSGCYTEHISQVTSGGFTCAAAGAGPTPNAYSGTGMAGYNSWSIYLGGISDLVSPALNFSGLGTMKLKVWIFNQNTLISNAHDSLFIAVNTTPTFAGSTVLYANDPEYNSSPAGWTQYTFTIPSSFSGTTNYIVFRGQSYYGQDIFFDEVQVLTATPPAPTFTSNSPVCPFSTATFTATTSAAYPSPTFTLTGPGITAQTSTTGVFNLPNVTAANAGTFSVTVSSGGFTSAPATTTLALYPTPTAISTSNIGTPSSCLSPDGSFQINGLGASTSYTLIYRLGGVTQPNKTITSNGSGSYLLGGLLAGVYDSIRVISGAPSNCTSNVLTAPVIVPAPNPPATPVINYTNPVCPGSTLSLSVNNVLAGATYSWLAP
ncbi:MAG: hypothetical protein ABI378_10870, partial [Chitinophagaceae bacterium]